MIDVSRWQDSEKNKIPRLNHIFLKTTVCSDNIIRIHTKNVRATRFLYYMYDFENDEDIILNENDK